MHDKIVISPAALLGRFGFTRSCKGRQVTVKDEDWMARIDQISQVGVYTLGCTTAEVGIMLNVRATEIETRTIVRVKRGGSVHVD